MDGSKKSKKSPKSAAGTMTMEQLGNARETWCTVELDHAQFWSRRQLRHYKNPLKSSVFDSRRVIEERCTWKVNDKTHKERRHFSQSHNSQLVI